MAEIPSDIGSSAAQASFQAKEVAKEREARRAGGADAVNRVVKAVDEQDTTVDTEDADTAIFADAEGAGSQGRPFEEQAEGESDGASAGGPENGLHTDEDGQLHLDLEA